MSGISKRVNGSWASGSYSIMKTATDTLTTLPADLYADGTAATIGLVGNMSQTGTPTPSNPIQPQETGERTGNLIRFTNTTSTSGGGATISQTAGKSEIVIVSRTATEADGSVTIDVLAELTAGTYTLSVDGITVRGTRNLDRIFIRDNGNNIIVNNVLTGRPQQFTISEDVKITKLSFVFAAVAEYSNQVVRVMLNEGSTAEPYKPYGIKIPISSANTTTPVYLGEVETTRKIKKLVLTGDESWRMGNYPKPGSYQFYIPKSVYFPDAKSTIAAGESFCTHFINQETTGGIAWGTNFNIYMPISDLPENATADDFKAYLAAQYAAGTPVTIWYVLATPTTGIVNEPIRKIGDYADTVSGITIPTIAGKDTFDVQTTLKPSEVTAYYHGWHTGTVHERESGQWD